MNSKQKNNATADEFRVSGNEHYNNGEYFFALLNYNHSLCYAESASEQWGMACANRSAVYFELKQFKLCLQNIQLVKLTKYPKSKMDKLIEREEKCKELMKTNKPSPDDDDPLNFFKLSYPAKKKYPGIADCIELRKNKKFGNFLITTKALKTGDVIAVEDPSFTATSSSARLYRCFYCCEDALLNLIPCPGCAKAMFCSAKCCLDALNETHQYECDLKSNPVGRLEIPMSMRMLLKYLNIFDGNALELKKFLEDNKEPVTVFDFDFSDQNDPMYQKHMMLVELSLRNASNSMNFVRPKDRIDSNAFIKHHPALKELWRQHGRFLNGLLEKLFKPAYCVNNISISASKPINLPAESEFEKTVAKPCTLRNQNGGAGLHPAVTLMNSSCDPNVTCYISVRNKQACIAIKPIPAGSQLFRQYLTNFYDCGPADLRKEATEDVFGFTCDCIACKNDWPTLSELPAIDPSFDVQISQTYQEAKANIKNFVEYIEKNHRHKKPTKEVYTCISNIMSEYRTLARPSFLP